MATGSILYRMLDRDFDFYAGAVGRAGAVSGERIRQITGSEEQV
jgi:hypothetical protein